MPKFFSKLFLLLIFICISALAGQKESKEIVLKILTYNIYHGATMKGDFDLDLIANVIQEKNPDLVALQEVDYKTNRAHKMDLALELAERTDMIPLFGRAMFYDDGEYGEAILSKYTFQETINHSLPYTEGKEPRAALQAIIELPSGDEISFIGTHLDHTRDQKNRTMQSKEINKIFSKDDRPAILAGDLNAIPGSKTINILKKQWVPVFKQNIPTYPSDKPVKKLDYIMFKPAKNWQIVSKAVIKEKVASDHFAVYAELKLVGNGSGE